MSTLKVIHDRQKCIGCNSCVTIAPQSWIMDEKEGKSVLIGSKKNGRFYSGNIFACDEDLNREAAKACPMRIIKIVDPIDEIRQNIASVDKELIILLAKRFELAKKLGQLKSQKKQEIIDKEREKTLFEEWEKIAANYNVNPKLIHKLWNLILDESIHLQSNPTLCQKNAK